MKKMVYWAILALFLTTPAFAINYAEKVLGKKGGPQELTKSLNGAMGEAHVKQCKKKVKKKYWKKICNPLGGGIFHKKYGPKK